jgi:hypothetical protein
MTKKLKLFIIDEKPFLVSLDEIQIGDKAIMTVGGQYPSIVECSNQTTLNLITDPKLSLNQAYKIFMEPEKITLTGEQIDKITYESDGVLEVEIENGELTYNI